MTKPLIAEPEKVFGSMRDSCKAYLEDLVVPESVLVTIRSAVRQTVDEDQVHDNL